MQKISILLVFLSFVIWLSCTRDEAPEISCEGVASWDLNIKMIIQTNCVSSECHDGSTIAPGIFLEYEGIKPDLVDGSFEDEVVNSRTMPPFYAENSPTELTQEELDLVICWIAEGYPEN